MRSSSLAFLLVFIIWSTCNVLGQADDPTRIKSIRIERNTIHPSAQILRQLKSKEGDILDKDILDEDISRLYKLNWFYDVKYRIDGENVVFTVVEKRRVVKISFAGRRKVREGTLRDELSTEIGDFVNPYLITRDIEAIKKVYKKKGYILVQVTPRYEDIQIKDEDMLYKVYGQKNMERFLTNPENQKLLTGTKLTFAIEENPNVRIKKVTFVGNDNMTDKKILKVIKTKPDRWFTSGVYKEDEFKDDLNRIRYAYISQGWIKASVTSPGFDIKPLEKNTIGPKHHRRDERWIRRGIKPKSDKVQGPPKKMDGFVTFNIDEGDRYFIGDLKIENNTIVETETILEEIAPAEIQEYPNDKALEKGLIKRGGIYSPSLLDRAVKLIELAYGKKGYMFTRVQVVESIRPQTTTIDLVFRVLEGRPTTVRNINVEGNDKTRDVVIRRELEVFPGEQLTADKLEESKEKLFGLDYFEDVKVDLKEIPETAETDIDIKVKEKNTGNFKFGIGFSSVDNVIGNIGVTQRNFDWRSWPYPTGDGQTVNMNVKTGSRNRTISFNFFEPYVNDLPLRFGFGAFTSKRENRLYDEKRRGANVTLGKEMWKNIDVSIGYSLVRTTIDDIDSEASNELKAESGTLTGTAFLYNIGYSTLNRRIMPTKGAKLYANTKMYAKWLGGDLELWETTLGAKHVKSLKDTFGERHHLITNSLTLNLVGKYGETVRVPIWNRYFAGGLTTVRGYPTGQLTPQDSNGEYIGGNFMPRFSSEYTYPLYDKILRGALFFDAGYAYRNLRSFSFGDIHKGAGFGLRIQTPLSPAPVQLDYGFALDRDDGKFGKGRFEFSFGTQF